MRKSIMLLLCLCLSVQCHAQYRGLTAELLSEARRIDAGQPKRASPEARMHAYADRIEARGGYCVGIARHLRMTVQAQGAASPYVGELLGKADKYGCLR